MFLDEILKNNSSFSPPPAISRGVEKKTVIFTCVDSRLVDFLESAMGVSRGDVAVIKNAGNHVTEDVLRSLAVTLFSFEIKEILVIGHTDCMIAKISAYDFTEAMKRQGVNRDAIPSGDLRGWLGAASSERERVRDAVNALRRSSLIPREVLIHGLLVDINSGSLELVVRGTERDISVAASQAVQQKPQSILDRAAEWIRKDEKPAAEKQSQSAAEKSATEKIAAAPQQGDWLKKEEQPASMKSSARTEDLKSILSQSIDWLKREEQPSSMQSPAARDKKEFQASSQDMKKDEKKGESYDWGVSFDPGTLLNLDRAAEQKAGPAIPAREPQKAAPPAKAGDTRQVLPPQADIAARTEKSAESFEVWLEDLGLFSDDVRKELRRLTGVTVDDVRALQEAVLATKSPQEAQRIKRALQSLGARAIIKRVRKIIRQ
jgi:carbonic anhydrase